MASLNNAEGGEEEERERDAEEERESEGGARG